MGWLSSALRRRPGESATTGQERQHRVSGSISGVYGQSGSHAAWWQLAPDMSLADGTPYMRPDPGVYLSFSQREDFAVCAYKKSKGSLLSDLVSEIGEPLFVQHMRFETKGHGSSRIQDPTDLQSRMMQPWLYATSRSRILGLPQGVHLVSGHAGLRALLASNDATRHLEAPFVAGILFEGSANRVLILAVCDESGAFRDIDYIPLADLDPAAAIRSFVQSVRLSASGDWTQDRTAIFSSSELLGLQLKVYPNQSEIFGLPVPVIWRGAAATGVIALAGVAGGSAALAYVNDKRSGELGALVERQRAKLQTFDKSIAGERLVSVLSKRSVNVDATLSKASAVWQNGARVSLLATPDSLKLTVKHPIADPEQTPQTLAHALRIVPPTGCARQEASASRQVNDLYVTYECQTSDPELRLFSAVRR